VRILLLSQWFDPEPTFKGLLFAKALQRLGHEVSVLTGFPNYPGGEVYPGYRVRAWRHQEMDGVPVLRVALYPDHSRSAWRRVFNYLSFAASASLASLMVARPDVVYAYHPPGSAVLPALLMKRLRGVPFVLDVQDLWPETLPASGMLNSPRLLGVVQRWMDHVYRRADQIVVLSPGFRDAIAGRGIDPVKISVIPNWTYEEPADDGGASAAPDPAPAAGRFDIVFAGTMGRLQALDTLLDAAALLQARKSRARFILVGGGVEAAALAERAREMKLDNVAFLARRSPAAAAALLAGADALLVHLKDDPLFAITIPSKIQAYLRAGRPILAGVTGDAADLVETARAGLSFAPGQPAAMAAAVERMIALDAGARARMGENGARFYREHLALPVGAARFAEIFARTARGAQR
jgi:glycosyltransferase involved in cell wall biosynthesis